MSLKEVKQAIHLGAWEVQAMQLRATHAAEALKETQLLHVTKDLQVGGGSSTLLRGVCTTCEAWPPPLESWPLKSPKPLELAASLPCPRCQCMKGTLGMGPPHGP